MNILFSPVGLTDPISNFRDGALLHICRYYDIDKIYLYMSKEIHLHHNNDNRYIYSLDKLGELIGKKFEYDLIVRENLVDVHIFDVFIDEFRSNLNEIHSQYPDANIFLNISSGTPAMKSALQILAAFREFEYIPIQVATPEKKSNPKVEDKDNYECDMQWECNEDNKDAQNRCAVSGNVNFLVQIKKAMLRELINKYDYAGAQILANTMKEALNSTFIELLDAAVKRDSLSYKKANAVFKKYGFLLMEEERSDYSNIAEFLLFVNLKKCKGEYSDFLRAITPLLVNIFKKLLKDRVKIDINDYTREENGIKKWDINKLNYSPEIKSILDNQYKPMKSQPIYSDHLVTILSAFLKNSNEVKVCEELRKIEKLVRNLAAHEIIAVDDDWIYSKTGFTTEQIISKMLYVMRLTKINITDEFLSSYDKMNDFIIKKMEI